MGLRCPQCPKPNSLLQVMALHSGRTLAWQGQWHPWTAPSAPHVAVDCHFGRPWRVCVVDVLFRLVDCMSGGGFVERKKPSRKFNETSLHHARFGTPPTKSFNHSQPHIQFVRFLISTVACWPWNWRWLLPHFPPVPSIPALLLQHDVSIVPGRSPLPTPLVGMTASVAPSCDHLSQLHALPAIKVSF